jgi:hypothetical protein
MPTDEPAPARSQQTGEARLAPTAPARQNTLFSTVSLPLLASFAALAVFAFLIAFFILPAKPGKSWIASTASNMIWISVFIIAGCLASGALYWLNADIRAIMRRFRFMRVELGAIVIMQPPAVAVIVYSIALLHSTTLWNRPLFALLCGPLAAGAVFLVVAQLAGQLAAKEIREYLERQGHLERPSGLSSQTTTPPEPNP